MTYEKFLHDIQYLIGRLILDGNDRDLEAVNALWVMARLSHVMEIEVRDLLATPMFAHDPEKVVDGAK